MFSKSVNSLPNRLAKLRFFFDINNKNKLFCIFFLKYEKKVLPLQRICDITQQVVQ